MKHRHTHTCTVRWSARQLIDRGTQSVSLLSVSVCLSIVTAAPSLSLSQNPTTTPTACSVFSCLLLVSVPIVVTTPFVDWWRQQDDEEKKKKKKKRVFPNSLRNPDVAVNKSIVNNPNPNKNLKNKKQKEEEEKKSTHFECNRNKQLSSATMSTMMVMGEEVSSGLTLVMVAKHIGEEGSWGEELGAGEKIDKASKANCQRFAAAAAS